MRASRLPTMLLGCGLVAAQVAAAPLDTAGVMQCEVRGYAKDRDPDGTNVRVAPRADGAIIGRLAPLTKISADEWTGVEFDIVGSKNGWLLIKDPNPPDGMQLDAGHTGDGRGWIWGGLVGTQLASVPFRAGPRREAPLVTRLIGKDLSWSPMSVGVVMVHGCEGKYIEVTTIPPGSKPLRGWSYRPCSSQLTTCDGWRLEE